MKIRFHCFFIALVVLAITNAANAATVIWTNAAGGDWNNPTNWLPNQVPLSGDNVFIINAGTYTVTNSGSATLGSLTLGGTNGIQTLTIASLTLTNASMVNSNGVLNWLGGDLEWALTVAAGGTLNISNTVSFAVDDESPSIINSAALTNYGTVVWAGTITSYANYQSQGGTATIDNAGLWESVADNTIQIAGGGAASASTFINTGTLEKIGGTGTTTINWNFINNGGKLDSQTNTISLAGNYNLTGGTLNVGINSLTSYGVITLSGSPAVLTGTVSANLNNGYVPTTNNLFSVLTYSSESGAFNNFNLPLAVLWQTNYGATAFTLTVVSASPASTNLLGHTVHVNYLYSETNEIYINFPSTNVPSAGVSFNIFGNETLTVSPTTITMADANPSGSYYQSADFNGFSIKDLTSPGSLAHVTIDPASNIADFDQSRIYFDGTTLYLNFQGLSTPVGSFVQLDVNGSTNLPPEFSTTNLLLNHGAETGTLTNWISGGSSNPGVDNGTFDSGINPHTGNYDFYGGNGAYGSLSQVVSLVGNQGITAEMIDYSNLAAGVSFWEQGLNQGTPSDDANITLTFFGASSNVLTTVSTPVIDSHNLTWSNYVNQYAIPSGTRFIQYTMNFYLNDGSDLDAFIDDNSLSVLTVAGLAPPLVVTTTSLTNGTNGVPYSQTLTASGGQTPYSWTNISGRLPSGLTLMTNGVISGTPTASGTFNFMVKVTDANSSTATQALTLAISPAPNLLVNGGFESEPNWGNGIGVYDPGETELIGSQIPGWTIVTNHAVTVQIASGPYLTISGNYSVNTDGEGYDGNNANFYQDFATQNGVSYALEFNWQSWGAYTTPTTSQLEISVVDTVTTAVLFDGLYSYDGSGPHPVHDVLANFAGTGNPLRLRIQESPQSGYNDNTFVVDNFSVTVAPGVGAPVPSGLVAWWPGDGNALDIAGGNNGTLVGGVTYTNGEVGQAFDLDGTSGFVVAPASASLNVGVSSGLTVEGWIDPASTSTEQPIVEWNNGTNLGAHFWISVPSPFGSGPGCLYGNLIDTTGVLHYFASPAGLITANTFQDVALTYDTNSGLAVLYINGASVAQQNLGVFTPQTSYNVYLGNRPGGAPITYWGGLLDEIRIYNRALSSNEIAAIYAAEGGSVQPVPPVLTVSLSSGTGTTASASGRFVLASSPVVGGQPQSVAVADVNGDGRLDLIANGLVLTNNGSGGFGSNSAYSVGTFGSACVVATDVNGDGKPDLITAIFGNTTLTVFTNNGAGVFGSNATLNVNSSPQCVVAADVNGDGKPDLICASSSGARFLSVFTNNGTGGFVLSSTPANGNVRAFSVVTADVNGDGKPDLITANFTASTLSVFTNNGTGVFGLNASYAVGAAPYSVVAADVNGDGKPDLITANFKTNTLTVFTNNGGGGFGLNAIYTVGNQPRSVVAADINGDGKVDLICANAGDGTLTVLTNNGIGGFELSATYTVGSAPYSVVAADVNGDGPVDLVGANEGSGTLTVLTNTATLVTGPFKNVILSWPASSTGFVLQQNSNLATASWLDVTNTPAVTNDQNQVTIPVTPQNNFFRLLHQ